MKEERCTYIDCMGDEIMIREVLEKLLVSFEMKADRWNSKGMAILLKQGLEQSRRVIRVSTVTWTKPSKRKTFLADIKERLYGNGRWTKFAPLEKSSGPRHRWKGRR